MAIGNRVYNTSKCTMALRIQLIKLKTPKLLSVRCVIFIVTCLNFPQAKSKLAVTPSLLYVDHELNISEIASLRE